MRKDVFVYIYRDIHKYILKFVLCGYKLSNMFLSSARVFFFYDVGVVFKSTVL